jgi:hypothetical protein
MFFVGQEKFKKIIFVAYLAVSASRAVCASDYQDGLSAYIDGDFGLAHHHWLEAAHAKDAKSMFNLGLLHEQNKLVTSTSDDAVNWYRLAADNGYAPASYHLAQRMLERGGSDDEAIALIQHAADKGYAPARRHLGLPVGPAVVGNSSVAFESGVFEVSELGYQTESWINRQKDTHWTIQLLAFTDREQVLTFIESHQLQRKTAYFSEVQNGEVFYKLIYGSFKSKDIASSARQSLSPALKQHGPWLRTWSSVQKITK